MGRDARRWYASAGSGAPNTADPATNRVAPASATEPIVSGWIPPSTSIRWLEARAASLEILSGEDSMNGCPPQPGLTDMHRTRSAAAVSSDTETAGVPGFRAMPARQPASRIACSVRFTCASASKWNVMQSAPARANASMWSAGLLDHQVDVDRAAGVVHLVGDRPRDERPDGDRRHEVAVHDVDVDHPGPGRHHLGDLVAEPGEVGREDRGRDPAGVEQLRSGPGARGCPVVASIRRAAASSCRNAGRAGPRRSSCGRSSGAPRSSGTARRARSAAGSRRSGTGPGAGSGAARAPRSPGQAGRSSGASSSGDGAKRTRS